MSHSHVLEKPKKKRPVVVQKYGGSSLATPEQVQKIARKIVERKEQGVDLVVVVSAMGKTTDEFIKLAHQVNPHPTPRELDMLISVGERISISMVTLAINAIGKFQAISFTGSQIGLVTDTNHTNARIVEIKGYRLREALAEDKIVVIAGFQGVSTTKEITTLGRGGSDTTAVALAAALEADCCEILSDVDGIYSADPRFIKEAKRLDVVDYDLALEMSAAGARMLHKTAVEFAKKHNITLSLGLSTTGEIGTIVTRQNMSDLSPTGVVVDSNLVVFRIANAGGALAELLPRLSTERYKIKLWQYLAGTAFLVCSGAEARRMEVLCREMNLDFSIEHDKGLLSLIGAGVSVGSTAAGRFFKVLAKSAISFSAVLSGELFLKVLIGRDAADTARKIVHDEFFNP
jgi:aspartate kinase